MPQVTQEPTAQTLMMDFAQRTGLTTATEPQRYLWTDAFAVCNFLELNRQTGDAHFKDLAIQLVDQVHHVLGQHRSDDSRSGWISGLDDHEGKRHPTAGGLRIGKPLPERKPDEGFNERLEWDRDGQYFHYLTKWMHALRRVSQATDDDRYVRWAIELAETAHARFAHQPTGSGRKRMYWKMSIDLSRPLVSSQGQHDPLDGLITYQQLRASDLATEPRSLDLDSAINDLAEMCEGEYWTTADPLGLGGLLADVYRVAQLQQRTETKPPRLLSRLLDSVLPGIQAYAQQAQLQQRAEYRLGFRELGLSIGLRAIQRLKTFGQSNPEYAEPIEQILRYQTLADEIEAFWQQSTSRSTESWTAHRDINDVMLATNLAPDGYLAPPDSRMGPY